MKKKLTLLVALSIIIGYIIMPVFTTGEDEVVPLVTTAQAVIIPSEEEVTEEVAEPLKTTEQIAEEINAGMWGCGDERRQLLTEAGYNYDEIQAKVNEMYPKVEIEQKKKEVVTTTSYSGTKLNRSNGTVQGPSGKETYYNLPMGGVIKIMSSFGYSQSDYWVREDGCKMLGQYIMVAAHLGTRPRGSLVETSLGTGIVCDTGGFAKGNPTQLDIATAW